MKQILVLIGVSVAIALSAAAPAQADAEDFDFASFDGQYNLSRDADGYSHLSVVETLVAEFPDSDQNHGIVRGLVDSYDGHPVDTDVASVTDGDGNPVPYDEDSDDGKTILTIGDADEYVHGEQTYVISYSQSNVTKFFADSDDDEFYWDTVGFDSEQQFASATATVTVADDLIGSLTGKAFAPYGAEDATAQGEVTPTDTGYAFSAPNGLGANQNLTMIVGFAPHTFAERPSGFFDAPWPVLALVSLMVVVLAAILAIVLRITALSNAPGRGTIIAEYVAPKGVSLPLSAIILGKKSRATSAMIIHLAVSGALRIVEVVGKANPKKSGYRLDYLSADGLDADDLEFMHALFGPTFEIGESRSLTANDESGARKIAALLSRVNRTVTTEGYRKPRPISRISIVILIAALGTVLTLAFSFISLSEAYGGAIPVVFITAAIALVLATAVLLAGKPLSAKGVELRDYLAGLKVYIDLAEEDRLRYLQSPQGVERVPIATEDSAAVLKLNEKLLAYAVLFGNERQWAGQLGRFYEQTGEQPNWYAGSRAFNAVYFASSIGSLNASTATSFTSSSSSSGGTSGGGYSGGGGGGGSVGGW